MKNKNGFTLIELLVTISMLAVIGSIIIYNTIGLTNDTKDLQYERMVENIKNSAKTYVSLYSKDFNDLYTSKAFTYVKIGAIIDAGLLDEDTTNPYTNKKLDRNDEVKVYVDGDSYEMVYVYPVTAEDRNTSVYLTSTTLTKSIESDNPDRANFFYIYEGIKTKMTSTDLSLVNEEGQLINDYASAGYASVLGYYKEYYKFKVTNVPSSFKKCTSMLECQTFMEMYESLISGMEYSDFYRPTKAGTYYITYQWQIPGSSTTKSATRKVVVVDTSEEAKEAEKNRATTTTRTTKEINEDDIIYDLNGSVHLTGNYVHTTDTYLFNDDSSWTIDVVANLQAPSGATGTILDCTHTGSWGNSRGGFKIVYHSTSIVVTRYNNDGTESNIKSHSVKFGKKVRFYVTHEKGSNKFSYYYYDDYESAPNTVTAKIEDADYAFFSSPKEVILGAYRKISSGGVITDTEYMLGTIHKLTIYKKAIPAPES